MRRYSTLATILAFMAGGGCAQLVTSKAPPGSAPDGIRVYPPKVYLFVDAKAGKSKVLTLPDYEAAYDVKPRTIWAKQDFEIDVSDGQVTKLSSNNDTAAFLDFFRQAGELAAKAAGVAVSAEGIEGTLGLPSGMYALQSNGTLQCVAGECLGRK